MISLIYFKLKILSLEKKFKIKDQNLCLLNFYKTKLIKIEKFYIEIFMKSISVLEKHKILHKNKFLKSILLKYVAQKIKNILTYYYFQIMKIQKLIYMKI